LLQILLNFITLTDYKIVRNSQDNNARIVADFTKLIDKLQTLIDNIKVEKTYEFNIAKIVSFITTKGIEKGLLNLEEIDE
jgi:uncharacterized protein YeeX (DUF496 family)